MRNVSEALFEAWAAREGWVVTKRGWPDFICRRGEEVMAVEVKFSDWLSRHQRSTIADLAAIGLPVYIWTEDDGLRPGCDTVASAVPADASFAKIAEELRLQLADADRRTVRLRERLSSFHAERKRERRESEGERERLLNDLGYLLRQCEGRVYPSVRMRALRRRYADQVLFPDEAAK